jgi:hypothetical protein
LIRRIVIEVTAPDLSGHKVGDLLISAFVTIFTFLLVRFGTHVILMDEELARLRLRPTRHAASHKLDTSTPALVTQAKLVRVPYFVIVKRVKVQEVTAIVHPAAWLSDEMRALAVMDQSGSVVKMTAMAYGRDAVADVARRRQRANPRIRFDEDALELLRDGKSINPV